MIIVNCKWSTCLSIHLSIFTAINTLYCSKCLNNLTHWNTRTTWWTRFFDYPYFTEAAAIVDFMICSGSHNYEWWKWDLQSDSRVCILITMHLYLITLRQAPHAIHSATGGTESFDSVTPNVCFYKQNIYMLSVQHPRFSLFINI